MKGIYALFVTMVVFGVAIAQDNTNPFIGKTDTPPAKAYLGLSTGINNMAGFLAIQLDAVVNENISIGGAYGLSTWGSKWAINLKYYPKGFYGFTIKGGYSRNSGLENFETEMELQNGSTEYVVMDLNPVGNVFFTLGYTWKLGKRNKFYLEGGYALPLETEDYYTLHDDQVILSSTSEQVLKILRPGGVIFSLGFNFGL